MHRTYPYYCVDSSVVSQSEFTDPFLRRRYGIKNSRSPSWVLPAVLIAIIGGGWLIWSANHYSKPETRSTLISFQQLTTKSIEIRYSLTFRTDTIAHKCRLIARDFAANVVGEVTDTIPAGSLSVDRTIQIPTRVAAVNAGIDSCHP